MPVLFAADGPDAAPHRHRRVLRGRGPVVRRDVRLPEVDDEGKTFFYRFFIHDHLNRLFEGVHTTTPGGTFIYFIEQGGYALFPWVALLPGALAVVSPHAAARAGRAEDRWRFIALVLGGCSASS